MLIMHTTKTREQIQVHQLKWSMWELLEDDQVFELQLHPLLLQSRENIMHYLIIITSTKDDMIPYIANTKYSQMRWKDL
jgi:hypothetical protein